MPAPASLPFRPGPPFFEQLDPNTWRETPWAAARCVYGDAPLAKRDRLHCPAHAARFAEGVSADGAATPEEASPDVAPEQFDFGDIFDRYQDEATDRYWSGDERRGAA